MGIGTKKITKATLKSFIRKNKEILYINEKSSFDGMVDGVVGLDGGFRKAVFTDEFNENNLGIVGAWLVHGSRNSFQPYEDEIFQGIEVYNCCGCFILATKK